MAQPALLRILQRCVRPAPAVGTRLRAAIPQVLIAKFALPATWCRSCNSHAAEFDENGIPKNLRPKKLKPSKYSRSRQFLGVTEIVAQFETALIQGERIGTDDPTYDNLKEEAKRIRLENDAIMVEVEEVNMHRSELVEKEDQILSALASDDEDASGKRVQMLQLLKQIQGMDYKVAGLRCTHFKNIKDVGLLKRTIRRIEVFANADALIGRVDAALENDNADADGSEAAELEAMVSCLRNEYDSATLVVKAYREEVIECINQLGETGLGLRNVRTECTLEADEVRMKLISHLQHMKRMLGQLTRLRDIQVLDAKEIGVLERARAKLRRHSECQKLLDAGDAQRIEEHCRRLQKESGELHATIKDLEVSQQAYAKETKAVTARLRELQDVVTPETGRLRETLEATIDAEEQTRGRLAVFRGIQAQKVELAAMLKSAGVRKHSMTL